MTNFFEQVADRQLTGAQKAVERRKVRVEERRAEKLRPPTELEKKITEQTELQKLYRAWRRAIRDEIAERHGADFKRLMNLINGLRWDDAPRVVDHVAGAAWLIRADEDTRLATLNYITASFERSRIRHGLPPLDDGLWDEEPGPAIKCRRILFGY